MAFQYYANSDTSGKIIGFYNNDVHAPDQIPVTAVEIAAVQWQDALSNPRKYRVINNELVIRTQTEINQEIADEAANAPPIPESDSQKIARLELENSSLIAETTRLAERDSQIQDDQMFIMETLINAGLLE